MECFSGLHGVLPAVSDISHQQNLPVTEHPAAACPDDVQLHPVPLFQPLPVYLPLRKMVAVFLHHRVRENSVSITHQFVEIANFQRVEQAGFVGNSQGSNSW